MLAKNFYDLNDVPNDYTGLVYLRSLDYNYCESFWMFKSGIRERFNGPTITIIDKVHYWFINYEHVSEEDFWAHPEVIKQKLNELLFL